MKRMLILVIVCLFFGCVHEKQLVQRFAPKEDDDFARRFIDLIRHSQYDEAEHMIDQSLIAKKGAVPLTQFHRLLDQGEPVSFEIIGAHVGFFRPWDGSGSKRQSNLRIKFNFQMPGLSPLS